MRNTGLLLPIIFLPAFVAASESAEPVPPAKSPIPLAAAYEALSLEPKSATIQGLQVVSGHLSLALESGRAARVLAGDETVGIFFSGTGNVEYVSTDTVEFPVLRFNATKSTKLKLEKGAGGLRIQDRFETLLFLTPGRSLVDLTGVTAEPLEKEFAKHREIFLRDRESPASHQLTLWKLNAPASPFSRAELSGGMEYLVHLHDPANARAESLYAIQKTSESDPEIRKFLWPIALSEQPIGRDHREPERPPYLLMDVDYSLVASDGKEAALSVKETILPLSEGQRVLAFNLYNVMYDRVGVGVLDPRSIWLRSVTDGAGRVLPFDHTNDELLVDLGEAPSLEKTVDLRFELDGEFLIRPGRDNYWELGIEPWFPHPDFYAQVFSLHSMIKVRKPFVPFAPGTTLSRKEEGEYNVVENMIEDHIGGAVALAGKYETLERTRSGVTVRVASYAGRNEKAWEKLSNLAFGIMDYYQTFLGPFPCSELNIIEIHKYSRVPPRPSPRAGYVPAPACTMFITQEVFQPALTYYFSKGIDEAFAYGIARQYWGQVIKVPSREETWLGEAFSEYCAALFIRKLLGDGEYRSLVTRWKAHAREVNTYAPIPLAARIRIKEDEAMSRYTQFCLIREKGSYLLSRLHASMSDQEFLTFLGTYQKTFRWKYGATSQMPAVLEAITGKSYTEFFETNYWGTGLPE